MNPSTGKPTVFLLASTLVTGGAEKVVRALALGLPGFGFDTHVICLHGLGAEGVELSEQGATVHYGLARGRFDPGTPCRLARIMRRRPHAVLVTLDHHDAIFWGGFASLLAGAVGRVLSVHSTGLWSTGRSFTLTDRIVMPLYGRVVALARLHGDYLARKERVNPGKIVIINNGVDTERFSPPASEDARRRLRDRFGIPPAAFVVTIVAALRPEKNHEMFLRAASRLTGGAGEKLFLIVGEGREAGKLQTLSGELSLGDSVRFMGLRKDIPDILSLSDASVLCSYPVVETFPLSVLEAMACGIPVVATPVGSIPEMITDGVEGLLVPPGDTDALAGALERLADDPDGRRRMGETGRARVARDFSESRMVGEYARLIGGLLERSSPGRV